MIDLFNLSALKTLDCFLNSVDSKFNVKSTLFYINSINLMNINLKICIHFKDINILFYCEVNNLKNLLNVYDILYIQTLNVNGELSNYIFTLNGIDFYNNFNNYYSNNNKNYFISNKKYFTKHQCKSNDVFSYCFD